MSVETSRMSKAYAATAYDMNSKIKFYDCCEAISIFVPSLYPLTISLLFQTNFLSFGGIYHFILIEYWISNDNGIFA